jgi:hypothetical protein
MRCVWLALLAFASSCFALDYDDCQLRCSSTGHCPDGLTCVSGFCRSDPHPMSACKTPPAASDAAGPAVADAHTEANAPDAGKDCDDDHHHDHDECDD